MAGEHIKKLETWVNSMNVEDVSSSQTAWAKVTGALTMAKIALELAAPDLEEGFGDSDLSKAAPAAFLAAAKRLEEQREPMSNASGALLQVEMTMNAAKKTLGATADAPGDAPKAENYPGLPAPLNLPLLAAEAKHAADVTAYNNSDDDARKQIDQLNKSYGEAIVVFTKIHGDPYVPIDPDGAPEAPTAGTPGAPTVPTGKPKGPTGTIGGDDDPTPVKPPVLPPVDPPWPPVDPWPPIDIGDPEWPDPEIPDPTDSTDPTGPTGPTGPGGPGVHPSVIGGGLLAGGLATPGAINGIRGLLSRGGLSSGGAGAIGSSPRAGGPGSLGRGTGGGAGAPGSQAGRGGRGGGGSAGSQAGRGGRGGRSGGAGGAGGRGNRRKGDRDPSNEQDLYDDGKDWLDDEGTAPGVLG